MVGAPAACLPTGVKTSPHERALRAAIGLALGSSLAAGCRSHPCPPTAEPDTTSSDDPQPQPVATNDPTATPRDPAAADELTEAECTATMEAFFNRTAPHEWGKPIPVDDPIVAQCCARSLAEGTRSDHRWLCCEIQPAPSIMIDPALTEAARQNQVCTPWGPPAPPVHRAPTLARAPTPAVTVVDLRAPVRALGWALPADAELELVRDAAIATWRGRMVNEYTSARVFEALATQLADAGLHGPAAQCRTFADQERRHGIECGAVVAALGGEARGQAHDLPDYPTHADASDRLEAIVRNVISICCMSETVAVALITAEREEMPRGPLRERLTRILADEVAHARFGWRLLDELAPKLDASARRGIDEYLRTAFAHLVEHELSHLPTDWVPPPQGRRYGLCDGMKARQLFARVVTDAIVVGLQARGFAGASAWRAAA